MSDVDATFAAGDPGWRRSLLALIPGYGLVLSLRGGGTRTDGLVMLRSVFVSFTGAIVMFAVVLVFLFPLGPVEAAGAMPSVVVGYGVISLGLARALGRHRLDCASETALASTYRSRFFLRIAVAEAAALLGFTGAFIQERLWIYLVGAAFALVGFALTAPSAGNLRKEQDALNRAGCSLSLAATLRGAGR